MRTTASSEKPPVPPLAHLGRGLGREQAAPLEQAQYPLSHGVLYSRNALLAESCRFAKPHTFRLDAERHSRGSATEVADQYRDGCFKHPIDNGAMEMQVGIERRAEPVDEGHCSDAGVRRCAGTLRFEPILTFKSPSPDRTGPAGGRGQAEDVDGLVFFVAAN